MLFEADVKHAGSTFFEQIYTLHVVWQGNIGPCQIKRMWYISESRRKTTVCLSR